MLVLTRKKNQRVFIYDGDKLLVEVTVAAVHDGRVRLGFTAPKEITVDREEVFESKRADANVMKRAMARRVVTKKEGMSPREGAKFQKSAEDLRHKHR